MIHEVICTSDKFEGQILLTYNVDGWMLAKIDFADAKLTSEQHRWLLKNLPDSAAELHAFSAEHPTLHFTDKEATFDMFWQRYADKERSSKKKTEAKWNKMTKAERLKAYNYIPKYFQSIPYGTCKKYATTYLNDELWNN